MVPEMVPELGLKQGAMGTCQKRGPYRKQHVSEHRIGWRYKRAVPRDLQGVAGCKEWSEYLGRNPDAARIRARALASRDDVRIAQWRTLTLEDRKALANAGGIEAVAGRAPLWQDYATHARAMVEILDNVSLGTALAPASDMTAEDIARQRQLLGSRTIGEGELAVAFQRARLDAKGAEARVSHTTALLQRAGVKRGCLDDLVETWKRVSNPRSENTVAKMRLYAGRFLKSAGTFSDPRKITRQHVMTFRDDLEKNKNLSGRSAAKHLEAVHRLLNVALSEGHVDFNAAHGIKFRKAGGKFADESSGKPYFQSDQVASIFAALKAEQTDFEWMVRLLAYHGMRSGEAVQLQLADVTVLSGVPVLRVHDRNGTVKNRHSVRDIPIHPACLAIVEYAKAAKGPWLFPSFPDWGDRRAAGFQRLASDFLRKRVKIADKALTMHSFRHGWRTLAREITMPDDVACSIGGWALGKGEHAKYGSPPSLRMRAEWICKIDPLIG
jgi:integrase